MRVRKELKRLGVEQVSVKDLETLRERSDELETDKAEKVGPMLRRVKELKYMLQQRRATKEGLDRNFARKENELSENELRIRFLRKDINYRMRGHIQQEEEEEEPD
jgi:hypothetical protein